MWHDSLCQPGDQCNPKRCLLLHNWRNSFFVKFDLALFLPQQLIMSVKCTRLVLYCAKATRASHMSACKTYTSSQLIVKLPFLDMSTDTGEGRDRQQSKESTSMCMEQSNICRIQWNHTPCCWGQIEDMLSVFGQNPTRKRWRHDRHVTSETVAEGVKAISLL